jgi:hypothetical protein
MTSRFVLATAERLDALGWGASSHADDYSPGHDCFREVAETGESRCGVNLETLNFMFRTHTARNDCAALVPSIQKRPEIFVGVILAPPREYRVALVHQERYPTRPKRPEYRCG